MTAPVSVAVLLDQLDAARAAATPGVWGQHPSDPSYIIGAIAEGEEGPEWLDVGDTGGRPPGYPGDAAADAACIVASVNAAPRLVAAVRAVLELADTGASDAREWGEPGSPYSNGATRAFDRLRSVVGSALAEEERR